MKMFDRRLTIFLSALILVSNLTNSKVSITYSLEDETFLNKEYIKLKKKVGCPASTQERICI